MATSNHRPNTGRPCLRAGGGAEIRYNSTRGSSGGIRVLWRKSHKWLQVRAPRHCGVVFDKVEDRTKEDRLVEGPEQSIGLFDPSESVKAADKTSR